MSRWTRIALSLLSLSLLGTPVSSQEKTVKKDASASAPKPDAKDAKATDKAPAKPEHVAYAETIWKYLTAEKAPYTKWKTVDSAPIIGCAPTSSPGCKTFANAKAAASLAKPAVGSVFVTEHYAADAKTKLPALAGVAVAYRPAAGYDARNDDWYWAYFLPGGKHVECSIVARPFSKPGFFAYEHKGRLFVFRAGSGELGSFLKDGDFPQHVVMPGVGPGGLTMKAPDKDTVTDYVIARPGFMTKIVKEQLWVLRQGSKEAADFAKQGPPAQHITRPLAGPLGLTLRSPDAATLDSYLTSKQGFVTFVEDGRLWVFRPGSKDLDDYKKHGELAKQVVQPGVGPGGVTMKSPDRETIMEYLTARDGFTTVYEKDRLWVFRTGAEALWKYKKDGELAQHIVRPAAGPMGLTVKAPDGETLDLYLKLASQ